MSIAHKELPEWMRDGIDRVFLPKDRAETYESWDNIEFWCRCVATTALHDASTLRSIRLAICEEGNRSYRRITPRIAKEIAYHDPVDVIELLGDIAPRVEGTPKSSPESLPELAHQWLRMVISTNAFSIEDVTIPFVVLIDTWIADAIKHQQDAMYLADAVKNHATSVGLMGAMGMMQGILKPSPFGPTVGP